MSRININIKGLTLSSGKILWRVLCSSKVLESIRDESRSRHVIKIQTH